MKKEAYKHDFSGSLAPDINGTTKFRVDTFSVGCFQWLPKKNGKGLKKSAVKFRVRGYVRDAEDVYSAAEKICRELDAGVIHKTKSCFV